jgi:NAD(P)-dependent dehydrogenase (short-subunit alcohol dehydrogenase family)
LHGWPLPQPERFKWRRCLLVILGALLATLLLGRLLESLRVADRRPAAVNISTIAAEPEGTGVAASGPVLKDPFADWAPKAVLIRLTRTSAPRAELVALPVRRAPLVRSPQ